MNKGNVIEIRCKKCNKLMMEYFVCGDDSLWHFRILELSVTMQASDDTQEVFRGNDEGTF